MATLTQTSLLKGVVLGALLIASANSGVSAGKAGTMQVVGNSGVSAQMMFLGTEQKVYILDKTENNPVSVNGHPAWAVEYDINSNSYRPMEVRSNTFCAGGMTLGDGSWLVTGGNKAVTTNGATAKAGAGYGAYNGGKALRFLSPCDNMQCQWNDQNSNQLNMERWYPTVEPLADGSNIILGGMRDGGFVPSQGSNVPTYEFYPPKSGGASINLPILQRTVPLSLYPIAYLMSSGEVFIQAGREAILWNYDQQSERAFAKIPGAPRVYPASGGSAMLPLTPADDYKETILFCGGTSLGKVSNWGNEGGPSIPISQVPASTSCEQISPFQGGNWESVDDLPERRSMGQFINLPDGTLWFGNGVTTGVAGYSTDPNSVGKPVGESYGDNPSYQPLVYDPKASRGNRWKRVGSTNIGRLYHSSATLLPDSSILVAGSNPNADVNHHVKWKTEYRIERWYPDFYDQPRPSNDGLPSSFSYGGQGFTIRLSSAAQAQKAKVVLIRTGFSTHGMNMGQRMIELKSTHRGSKLYVAQLPPNPNLFAPGPALAFVVVDGVPSQGKMVMVGNGKIGEQPVDAESVLPGSTAPMNDMFQRRQNASQTERDVASSHNQVLHRSGLHARHQKGGVDRY
ncbi:glyoxaloxidase 2 [Mycosarcoma maydis]|uniref:Glyoxaloxidase 2 n=1 Tax=Mycosarcoma maydis TaxID=5270 RepID=Q7Z867_MYCMD|nr:glyoxaloxidase 2 [Ustilago maydis 521]KIS70996.1 glyoxaloxidase 2 [Ustilago maydis 521]CAD79489.2 Glyoxaloxidase 2 [Ustilago maydis]|eukprot:XP_011386923.1 glyoxaloxidase 2 [Ustilago maydis 521]